MMVALIVFLAMLHANQGIQFHDELDSAAMQLRENLLASGRLIEQHDNDTAYVEYRLDDSERMGINVQYFNKSLAWNCLQGKWIHFIGDSRMRLLFASLISTLRYKTTSARVCPEYRACPFSNEVGAKTRQCGDWYWKKGAARKCQVWHQSTRTKVSYEDMKWAKPSFQQNSSLFLSPAKTRKPDVIFVNNGAWQISYSRNPKQSLERNVFSPPLGSETHEDRLEAFRRIAALVARTTLKVHVTYPACSRSFKDEFRSLEGPLQKDLRADGWLLYDAANLTQADVWRADFYYGHMWSKDLQPKHVLPKIAKWDQCAGPHTFDTITDLEVQVLLNLLCA